ncbi:MAG: CvpA family protein [Legionella sp.]|nr:CvpA family protein [Legionella sp.]
MSLNWIDILIISALLLSLVTGFIRGFLKELIGLMIWVLALWLAYRYSALVGDHLQPYIHDAMARSVTAFVVILFVVLLAGGILNILISLFVKHAGLSGTDRILGLGFGFVRGVFLVTFMLVIIDTFGAPQQHYTQKSLFYPQFKPLVHRLASFMSVWLTAIPTPSHPTEKNNS